jgi:hypothetical protein
MSILKVNTIQDRGGNTIISSDGSGTITPNGFGKIGQVIQGTTTTEINSQSSSFADTGLTATITPTSTSSKILCIVSQNGGRSQADNNNNAINIRLVRGSTTISTFFMYSLYMGTGQDLYGATLSINYLDSPATTSATTYKTQYANYGAGGTIRLQDTAAMSAITLMEVLA